MKSSLELTTILFASLAISIASPRLSHAQQPGDAGIFADTSGTVTVLDVQPNEPFSLYVVAFDLPDLLAYEGSIQNIPTEAILLYANFIGPRPLILGGSQTNFIVGTGGCVEQPGALLLAEFGFVAPTAVPDDSAILLTGSDPSSFGGRPGYARCDAVTIAAFGVATNGAPNYPDGAVILNATRSSGPVAEASVSFGRMKSRF